jgi:16S rRNA processing protein RimM
MPPADTRPPFLLLGQVLRPHGVRGELRLDVLTDYPERIAPGMKVYLGLDPDNAATTVPYQVVQARPHQQYMILQLEGLEDRNQAELLREQFVMIPVTDAVPLEDDEFYLYELIGLKVYTENGELLGEISEVLETGANDVYVIQGPRGEILLPATDECVVDIDLEAEKITVHLLDGLLGAAAQE